MGKWYLLLCSVLVLFGCQREDQEGDRDMTAVVDHVYTSSDLVPLLPIVIGWDLDQGTWHLLPLRTCASVDSITGDTAAFPNNGPVTVHLHFPDTGCTALDGRTRSGDLRLTLTEGLGNTGAQAIIQAMDHVSSGIHYRFTFTATCTAPERWTVVMDTVQVRLNGLWRYRLQGTYTYERTEGSSDPDPADDVYALAYSVQGMDRNGAGYAAYDLTDHVYGPGCKWIVSGVTDVDPENSAIRRVDFGTGDCDAYAEVSLDGTSIGLTIP